MECRHKPSTQNKTLQAHGMEWRHTHWCVWNGIETWTHLLSYKLVEPAGVNVVAMKPVCLQESDEVLDSGPEVSSDGQLLQSQHHVPGHRGHRETDTFS